MIRHLLAVAAIVALTAPWCPLSGLASEPASIVAGHIVNVAGKVRIRRDGGKNPGRDSKDVRFAKAGEVVMVGDIINTPSDGQIKLLLKDRSIMDLGPSSLFKVNAFNSNGTNERQVDATIVYGNLRTAVTQKLEGRGSFKVRSPSATMGVRGTEFVVNSVVNDLRTAQDALRGRTSSTPAGAAPASDAAQAKITVVSGLVAVAPPSGADPASSGASGGASSSGSSTLLAAGSQLTASMGEALNSAPPQKLDAAALQMTVSASRSVDNTFTTSLEIQADKKSEMAEQRSQANENNSQQANKQDQKTETKAESKQEVADGSGQAAGTAEPSKDVSPESVSSSGGEATAAAPPQTAASESTNRAPASDSAASAPPPPAPPSSGAVSFTGALTNGLSVSLNSAVTQSITTVNVVPAGTITTTQIVAPPPVFDPTAMYPIQIRVNLGATAAP